MSKQRSILIFAEPNTIVSDGLVPSAVAQIGRVDDIRLDGIVDVKVESDPHDYTGRLNYLRHYRSRLSDPKLLAWQTYRRLRGFRNAKFPPYPASLSMRGYSDSIHLTPPGNDVHHPDFLSRIRGMNPDVILLLGCSKILKKELIDVPILGVVNYHWSYLPEYRGRNATYWAAYNQEDYSGVTYHTIDEDLDQGNRINADRVKIRKGGKTLAYDSIITGRQLLTPVLGAISDGYIPDHGQISGGEYFSMEKYRQANTEFNPTLGFDHNSRIIDAKEGVLEKFQDGTRVMITGLEFGSKKQATVENGEVISVSFKGVKMNIGGEPHYINSLFYLPAYPIARIIGIEKGMKIEHRE